MAYKTRFLEHFCTKPPFLLNKFSNFAQINSEHSLRSFPCKNTVEIIINDFNRKFLCECSNNNHYSHN